MGVAPFGPFALMVLVSFAKRRLGRAVSRDVGPTGHCVFMASKVIVPREHREAG